MRSIFSPSKQRGICLTDKGLRAIGVQPTRNVPILALPQYEDRRWCEDCGRYERQHKDEP